MSSGDDFGPMGGGQRGGAAAQAETTDTQTEEDAASQKGIKGESAFAVNGGIFTIGSADDCLHAGGADSSGFGGFGGRQQDQFSANEDIFITINGGAFTIVSSGDCVDSNGALTINGGTLDLTCNSSGNTALDCDGTYTHSGGDVTTNDGSEENPGQMGGGMGGRPGGIRPEGDGQQNVGETGQPGQPPEGADRPGEAGTA